MHDSDEVLVPFIFKNGDGVNTAPSASTLAYEAWQNNGVNPAVKLAASAFDLIPATDAEIAAAFPAPAVLPTSAVWFAGRGPASPVGTGSQMFFVKAVVTQPATPVVTVSSPNIAVTRDPAIVTSGTAGAIGTPRPRQH